MFFQGYVHEGVGHIPLWGKDGRPRAWTIVDAEDYADAAQFRWHLSDTGYACRWYGGRPPRRKRDRLHRRVLGLVDGDGRQGDHIDRCRLNNRRGNLRVLGDDAESKQNVGANAGSTSAYRGVSWSASRQRWVAQARCGDERLPPGDRKRITAEVATIEAWRRAHMPFAVD